MKLSFREILTIGVLIGINVIIIVILYSKFFFIGTDGTAYALLGQSISEGRGFELYGKTNTIFSPLLPLFIAIFYKVLGNLETASYAAMIFLWLLSFPIFYYLLKNLASAKAALFGLLFYSFNGFLILTVAMPNAQIALIPFAMITFLALWKLSNSQNYIWPFVAGVSTGLSYLARPEYFFLIFLIAIYSWFIQKKHGPTDKFKFVAIILVGFAVVSMPYVMFLKNNLGYWTISGRSSAITLAIAEQDFKDNYVQGEGNNFDEAVKLPEELRGKSASLLLDNLGSNLKRLFKGMRDIERNLFRFFGVIGAAFFAFGVRKLVLDRRYKEIIISFISLAPIFAIAFIIEGGKPNYLVQFFYIFTIFIAFGFVSFLDDIKQKFGLNKIFVFLLVLATVGYLFFPIIQSCLFSPSDAVAMEYRTLGLWMKENIPNIKDQLVLSRKPEPTFYAGARFQEIPRDIQDEDDLIKFMKDSNTNYLIADSRAFAHDFPQFLNFLKDKKTSQRFKFITTAEFGNHRAVLYQLR